MSLEFLDGFDHYNDFTNAARKWTTASTGGNGGFLPGRFGGNCMYTAGQLTLSSAMLSNTGSKTIGAAVYIVSNSGAYNIITWTAAGNAQTSLQIDSAGHLSIITGGTLIASSTLTMSYGVWHYLEFAATIGVSNGAASVQVDGTSFISATNINTNGYTSYNTINGVIIGNLGNLRWDDLYIDNASFFWGDSRIITQLPSSDGDTIQWTPSTGTTHYPNVDDSPTPNDDADYNYTAGTGQTDLFHFPTLTGSGNIWAVQTVIDVREDAGATFVVTDACKVGSSVYALGSQSGVVLSSSYHMFGIIRAVNPATSAAWLLSDLNAAQFGYKTN